VKIANSIGFPIMIKASAGGGGKGIRIVRDAKDVVKEFNTAKSEAKVSFNDDSMYIEKFVEKPRHIEIQLLGDSHGNVVYLGERECSVQRRNQKVLEEAPSVVLTEKLRREMGETAVRAAKAIGYKNAGTIEFLVDKDLNFYFMEMNTRIQVEHPVTEMITGIDLIKEQIKVAYGEALSFKQEDIVLRGHSIECRINAENPYKNFMPSPGEIKSLLIPGGNGVRLDSGVYQGYKIPPVYDSMVGKLIVHGKDRDEAINKMKRALSEFIIEGIHTNIDLHLEILSNEKFVSGEFDTSFISSELKL
jgi:acetyl-CoA carboxylase, biotin carboxylase subunit